MTGDDFFYSLVRHLASALQVRYAFVAKCIDANKTRARTLAFWKRDCFGENFEYDVTETPCFQVLDGIVCHYAENVSALFPHDRDLFAGRFRSDLFYRLNVFPIQVPPLRERRSDIPQLVIFFLSRVSKKLGKKIEAVPQGIMDLLTTYGWPGNIRELQNLIERAVVLSPGPVLRWDPALLPAVTAEAGGTAPAGVGGVSLEAGRDSELKRPSSSPSPEEALTLEAIEKGHILAVLNQTGGVVEGPKGAAKILKLHPNTLRSRIKKLGIKPSDYEIS